MHNVAFHGTGTDELIPLVLSRLDHTDLLRSDLRASWIYYEDRWQEYPGGLARYAAYYESREHPESWTYWFLFLDGNHGICRPKDINAALAALNCEIDRRGDDAED